MNFTEICVSFVVENIEGDTPLMIAEEKNFDDCIELVSLHQQSICNNMVLLATLH